MNINKLSQTISNEYYLDLLDAECFGYVFEGWFYEAEQNPLTNCAWFCIIGKVKNDCKLFKEYIERLSY